MSCSEQYYSMYKRLKLLITGNIYVLRFKPTVKSTKLCTSDNGKHRDSVYFPKYKGAFLTGPAMDFRVMQLNGKLSALYT